MLETMFGWIRKRVHREAEQPLRAAPAVRRLKNYSAASGYAYEYCFEGFRDLREQREYVFRVSGDRKNWFQLSVFTPAMDRPDNERYAIAKMALFDAFDDREHPEAMREPVRVGAPDVIHLLQKLGLA